MEGNTTYSRYRRRNYFINKGLQGRFVIGFSSAVFIGILANILLVYFLIDRELAGELYKIHLKIRTTSQIAVPILLRLGAVTVPAILAASAVIGYFLTRRVERPLEEFRDAVGAVTRGDFTHRLSGETGMEISEPFNSAAGSLARRFEAVKGFATGLDESLRRLDVAVSTASKKEIEAALSGVRDARQGAQGELTGFRV